MAHRLSQRLEFFDYCVGRCGGSLMILRIELNGSHTWSSINLAGNCACTLLANQFVQMVAVQFLFVAQSSSTNCLSQQFFELTSEVQSAVLFCCPWHVRHESVISHNRRNINQKHIIHWPLARSVFNRESSPTSVRWMVGERNLIIQTMFRDCRLPTAMSHKSKSGWCTHSMELSADCAMVKQK